MRGPTPNPRTPLVTVLALADHILGREARTVEDFAHAGLATMGGCEGCHATIPAYNAYPSRTGFWRCSGCIGDLGWSTLEQARAAIFGEPGPTRRPRRRRGPEPRGARQTGQQAEPLWRLLHKILVSQKFVTSRGCFCPLCDSSTLGKDAAEIIDHMLECHAEGDHA